MNSSSRKGTNQPPCEKPSLVSSSGDPGPCATPSNVRNSVSVSLIVLPLRGGCWVAGCWVLGSPARAGPGITAGGKWHNKDERATEMVYTIPAEEWKARQQVSSGRRRNEAPI